MVVSHLRRWWGSRRLRPLIAGLTMLTVTVGAGSDLAPAHHNGPTRNHAGPAVSSTSTRVTRAAGIAPTGTYATDLTTAGMPAVDRSTSNGHNDAANVHFIAGAGTTIALVSFTGDRTNVAPAGVSADQTGVDIPPGAAAVDSDVAPLTGVSRAPRGPRAPPFLLV